jgi:hypothetical protein
VLAPGTAGSRPRSTAATQTSQPKAPKKVWMHFLSRPARAGVVAPKISRTRPKARDHRALAACQGFARAHTRTQRGTGRGGQSPRDCSGTARAGRRGYDPTSRSRTANWRSAAIRYRGAGRASLDELRGQRRAAVANNDHMGSRTTQEINWRSPGARLRDEAATRCASGAAGARIQQKGMHWCCLVLGVDWPGSGSGSL